MRVVEGGSDAPTRAEGRSACNSVTREPGGADSPTMAAAGDAIGAAVTVALEGWTATRDLTALERDLAAALALVRCAMDRASPQEAAPGGSGLVGRDAG